MKKLSILLIFIVFSCKAQEVPTRFSAEALNDTFLNLQDELVTFQSILDEHKDKTIVIDIWASWCTDCIKGMPKVKALQKENEEVVFLFLSLDKKVKLWKKGIKKFKIEGEHYYMQSGWDGAFGEFLDLDWIPRYMIIDKNQNITLFKAINAEGIKIKEN